MDLDVACKGCWNAEILRQRIVCSRIVRDLNEVPRIYEVKR